MSNLGDLRFLEYITVKNGKIIERKKILQQYRKDSWPSYKYWEDVDCEQRVIDIDERDVRSY